MMISRLLTIPLTLTLGATLAACGSSHAVDTSASAAPDAANASTAAESTATYPDWAAAAAPEYPSHVDESAITTGFFQIDTADDPKTVVAWYRAHATGGTLKANDPDAAPEWWYETASVSIDIQPNRYRGTIAAGKNVATMIAFTRKKQ